MASTEVKIKVKLHGELTMTVDERHAFLLHVIKKDGGMSQWTRRIAKEAYEKELKEKADA